MSQLFWTHRIVLRIKWDTAFNVLTQHLTHNKEEKRVNCDYSLLPPSWYFAWCLAQSIRETKPSANKCISDINWKQSEASQSSANVLWLRLALLSVPVLQANWVPLSPEDWLHHPSRHSAPIPEPKLSFLQQSVGTAGYFSGWFSSSLSEIRSSSKGGD